MPKYKQQLQRMIFASFYLILWHFVLRMCNTIIDEAFLTHLTEIKQNPSRKILQKTVVTWETISRFVYLLYLSQSVVMVWNLFTKV